MRTFEHGGDIKAFAKAYGCKADEVIDLSSNINFVRPNINIDFNSLEIASYPNYDTLYEATKRLQRYLAMKQFILTDIKI